MENKTSTGLENFLTIWRKVRMVCHFVPLLTTLGWILYLIDEQTFGNSYFVVGMMAAGVIAMLIARPWRAIKTFLKLTVGGVIGGFAIFPIPPVCIITAAVGLCIGGALAFGLFFVAPGAFTIYCMFNEGADQPLNKLFSCKRGPKVISAHPDQEYTM